MRAPKESAAISKNPSLLVEDDGAILIATLNRPEKLNAIDDEMMTLFEAASR